MKKGIIKILELTCLLLLIFCSHSFAMSRYEFDQGMKKGIEYFDNQMYYEARDEFQWFCDYNWGQMSAGQQKYALDYLGGTKQAIFKMEVNYVNPNINYQKFKEMVLKYGYYNEEENWYVCDDYLDEYYYLHAYYIYDISSNVAIILLKPTMGYVDMEIVIATDGVNWSPFKMTAIDYFLEDDGYEYVMSGGFFPYTDEVTLRKNNTEQYHKEEIIYDMELLDEDLQESAGISLSDLGINYRHIVNSMTAVTTL